MTTTRSYAIKSRRGRLLPGWVGTRKELRAIMRLDSAFKGCTVVPVSVREVRR